MLQANSFVIDLFLQLFSLVDDIYEHFGAWDFIIGAFFVYTLYRFLLQPLFGGGSGSDTVKKIRKEDA